MASLEWHLDSNLELIRHALDFTQHAKLESIDLNMLTEKLQ